VREVKSFLKTSGCTLLLTLLGLGGGARLGADIPVVLTDKIYQGSGVIDLMKDATGTQLAQYLGANGRLLLGVDVNENASGNESSTSQGIAIKSVQLLITTAQGAFSFSDIFTNTTALLTEAGSSTAQTYQTLFGQGGSSQITGSTSGFDLSKFDDVLEVRNVAVSGTITSAKLVVNFLDTGNSNGASQTFFDFSGGFEDFALLAPKDAQILEAAAIGTTGVSSTVTFTSATVATTYYMEPAPAATAPTPTTDTAATSGTTTSTSAAPAMSAPGAPEPPLTLLVGGVVLAIVASARERVRRRA
jgi:hypothetical protein